MPDEIKKGSAEWGMLLRLVKMHGIERVITALCAGCQHERRRAEARHDHRAVAQFSEAEASLSRVLAELG